MLKVHEVAAVVVATACSDVFATWVIRSVGDAAPPLGTTRSAPRVSPSESSPATLDDLPGCGPFREAVAKSRTILVIGDSSGDERGEWVDLWAQDLADNRKVSYHQWDSDAGFTASAKVYGTSKLFGSDKPISIWNLSYLGVDADYAQNLIDLPVTPDAVILSVGHDRDRDALDHAIGSTIDAVDRALGRGACRPRAAEPLDRGRGRGTGSSGVPGTRARHQVRRARDRRPRCLPQGWQPGEPARGWPAPERAWIQDLGDAVTAALTN